MAYRHFQCDLPCVQKTGVTHRFSRRGIYFKPEGKTTEKAIVSVKGGDNVNVSMIWDLAHVVAREKARIGVFITLAESTRPMMTEAIKEGYYETL